jgi:hypothetical protein
VGCAYYKRNILASAGLADNMIELWALVMVKTQGLFYKYEPKQVAGALKNSFGK